MTFPVTSPLHVPTWAARARPPDGGTLTDMSDLRPVPLPFVSPVAGVSHRQDIVRTLAVGDPVRVQRDPHNPHDANAVKISTIDGHDLGFVPAELAARLVLRPEAAWAGSVEELLRKQTWGIRVRISAAALPTPATATAGLPARETGDAPAPTGTGTRDFVPSGELAVPGAQVRARSGRLLGTLATSDGTHVVVVNDAGHHARYPLTAVSCTGP